MFLVWEVLAVLISEMVCHIFKSIISSINVATREALSWWVILKLVRTYAPEQINCGHNQALQPTCNNFAKAALALRDRLSRAVIFFALRRRWLNFQIPL
jgi:hypothetical protein